MSKRRLIASFIAPVALLAGCASSDFGGNISGSGDALSPEERRLQRAETKVSELSRRLDAVNLAGMDQENQRLRDDIRQLRGEMERMRYDADQQQRRSAATVAELDRRIQRFEVQQGIASPGAAPAPVAAASVSQGSFAAPAPAAPAPVPTLPSAPATAPGAATAPSTSVAPAAGAPVVISSGSGATVEEETAYLAAFDEFKNGKYDNAIRGFKNMVATYPQGTYAPNAYFWMGEMYTIKRDYKAALTNFQTILQRFPATPKVPDAMLKVGLTQLELKSEAEGRATLQRVISTYPNSNAAKLAAQRLNPPK
ncbi:tol-pal system protein YbgF [Solimonas sp. SE-A11]|uniref:tol-pal system protein YbgF n=1 Tax=Solimonas sp. SE-A11 TaxID=3054954 RepID=UPI00259D1BEB|nr:tol-pal system protein YbgF [Solimonas sp. SE-A11]MDM4771715.1 tol-pal system protein YbgF [Solimonas sp. SE-A11]